MKKIIDLVLPVLMEFLLKLLKPEQLEKVADKALDWCENAIKKSGPEYDDAILLPLIELVREAFGIEDND